MHARIVTFQVPASALDQVTAGIREGTQDLPSTQGFEHGYWIYDRDSATMTAVVLFDTAASEASEWEKRQALVLERVRDMTGGVPTVHTGEVVHRV